MDSETNILAYITSTEQYIWLYGDKQTATVIRSLGCMASNPEVSLTWKDAAVLAQTVRERAEERRQEARCWR